MKVGHILLIVVIIVAIVIGAVVMVNNNNEENNLEENVVDVDLGNVSTKSLEVTKVEELTTLVDTIYEGLELFPTLSTMEIDITDSDMLSYETGLSSADKIDGVVVSQPMMSSQAYEMVLVKVKDSEDADLVAQEMSENINPNKWICVSAEKVYATSSGNVAFLIMTNSDMADSVFESFKKQAGKIGPEYIINNALEEMPEDDMAIPAE